MSIQTESMRTDAQKEICVGRDIDGYFAVEWVNHSTPSGNDRWLPTYSDKRRWPTKEIAMAEFLKIVR